MAKYEDAILDFFKKEKDENKANYIFKVAAEIMDVNMMLIFLKDGRSFRWFAENEKEKK